MSGIPRTTHCILCGLPLVRTKRPLWSRLLGLDPPPATHRPSDGEAAMLACWRAYNERMGLDPNRPMPEVRR